VHSWQSGWEEVQHQQSDAVQALLTNPTSCLNGLNTDDEKREALVLLQHKARHCGTARTSTKLSRIEEGEEVPDWFIPPHEIEFGRHLADGAFGAVYEGTWRGADVVVKQVLTDQNCAETRAQFRQEVDLWYSLNHDHLSKLYGACHVGRAVFVCERATKGTLVSYVKGKERWQIWQYIYQAARGLRHLHDRGIVHGDLKGNNILVCQFAVKLADFGLSFSVKQADAMVLGGAGALGAYRWKAPECLMGCKPTFASDIYSFGMCIVEVLSGELPWGNMLDAVVKYNVVEQKLFPPQPDNIDEYDWNLASRMCAFDPSKRITANAVVSYAGDQVRHRRN
jgi:serine/threonine protein kinase